MFIVNFQKIGSYSDGRPFFIESYAMCDTIEEANWERDHIGEDICVEDYNVWITEWDNKLIEELELDCTIDKV